MPYHGGRRYLGLDNVMDFSVNANPVGPPNFLGTCDFLEYPDHEYKKLRRAISNHYGVEDVVPVNGASEALAVLPLAIRPNKIVTIAPSYGDYEERAGAMGLKHEYVFMKDHGSSFRIDELPNLGGGVLVYLSNPNNPTGSSINASTLRGLAEGLDGFLVVDEAYMELSSAESMLGTDLENVVVVRSFTKALSMPGLRAGFIYSANEEVIKRTRALLPSWNVNSCADSLITELLSNYGAQYSNFLAVSRKYVEAGLSVLSRGLRRLGMHVYESTANFILARGPISSQELADKLLRQGVLIRPAHTFAGLGPNHFRVAVKDAWSNEVLLDAIEKILE
ncbi:pyridoxal phosphate-dependent aminotransferase [Thermocladium modestius]|uniref:pyridoxal phosphate-dependent aminotransferase n=1 Tax=Thermocladium modestius TaxID=62609 RepID=UPI0016652AFB|nr:histidinol-phosphate transaminase [Thermocladium modestius]